MTYVHARSPPARFRVPGGSHDPARNRPRGGSRRGRRGALPRPRAGAGLRSSRRAGGGGLRDQPRAPRARPAARRRASAADRDGAPLRALDGADRLLRTRARAERRCWTGSARPATAAAGSRPGRRWPGGRAGSRRHTRSCARGCSARRTARCCSAAPTVTSASAWRSAARTAGSARARPTRPTSARRGSGFRPLGEHPQGNPAPWAGVPRTLVGVSVRTTPARGPFTLVPAYGGELLARSSARCGGRARRGGGAGGDRRPGRAGTDPSAVAFASRRAGEPWFCFEQPDRDGAALATLGCVRGNRRPRPGRFARAPRPGGSWPATPRPTRPTAPPAPASWPSAARVRARRRRRAALGGFGAGELVVPEVALARRGGASGSRWPRSSRPTTSPRSRRAARGARRPSCATRRCRCWIPRPPGASDVESIAPPEHYEDAVARAVERIRAGDFEKIVLAREVAVHAPRAARRRRGLRRAARRLRLLLRVLRRPRRRRVRRRLAGAAGAPRGPARLDRRARRLDAPLGRPGGRRPPRRAAAALRQGPRGAGDRRPPDRARAAPARGLGRPRPTSRRSSRSPTSSTSPRRSARSSRTRAARSSSPGCCTRRPPSAASRTRSPTPQIPALEGLDRGWYAGPVGWTDANEDGEFCVALRCALLRGARGAAVRRRRRRARLRPGGRAGRDRGQARRAAADPDLTPAQGPG